MVSWMVSGGIRTAGSGVGGRRCSRQRAGRVSWLLGWTFVAVPLLASERQVALDADSNLPVVEYARIASEIAGPEREVPLLRVYADGHVTVRYPAFMKRAGTWRVDLGPAHAQQLVESLVGQGLLDTNFAALRATVERAEAERTRETGERFMVTDESRTRIEVRVAGYTDAAGVRQGARKESIEWKNLGFAVERHGELDELRGLANAVGALEALLEHPALVREGLETDEVAR